jgi:hypothetical protein
MQFLETVPVECVLDAFRNDRNVTALGVQWPTTREDKIAILKKANRPVDRILNRDWGRYELDKEEFLTNVYPNWPCKGCRDCPVGVLLAEDTAGDLVLPDNRVEELTTRMLAQFHADEFELVGYLDNPRRIDLADGNNRVVAAHRARALPAKIKMLLGSPKHQERCDTAP